MRTGEDVAHTTNAGAVVFGLGHPGAVRLVAEAMPATPFLVEEMVTGMVAQLLIGIVADPVHGSVLTIGAGTTRTDLLGDTQSLVVLVDAAQINTALDRLLLAPVLAAVRHWCSTQRRACLWQTRSQISHVL
jgi:hypothetical protein